MVTMEKNKDRIWIIIGALCAIGACICIIVLCVNSAKQKKAAEEMSALTQAEEKITEAVELTPEPISTQEPEISEELPESKEPEELFTESVEALKAAGIPIPEKEVDILALQESSNADIYAWICIPDTQIDYPVLQHPTDDYYYLNYNIDGSKGYPGCIYSEKAYNNKEFTDSNTLLYGHNMKNGSMFANLHKYQDSDFFEKHPYVYIYTPDKLLVYEVFAAYEHSNEHLLYNHDFADSYSFIKYFEEVMSVRSMNNNFKEDITLDGDEYILTLSTCIANKPDNRYLVQGVLINED